MDEKSLIVQSNYLIEHRPKMTKDETRLFLTIVSSIKKDDVAFQPYQIPVQDFAEHWGIDNNSAYKQIKDALIGLNNKSFVIEGINPETNRLKFFSASYLSSASYEQGQGIAEVEISEKFKPYLLELKEQYTKYFLKNIVNLKGVHSIRTYELLKQYENLGIRDFSIAEYKTALAIEDKYQKNNDLKKRVLDPAEKEINSNTDIIINYEIKGRGSKSRIIFTIKSNFIEKITSVDQNDVIIKLADKMLQGTGRNANDYISYIKSVCNYEKADHKEAYLKSCIKNQDNMIGFLNQITLDLGKRTKRSNALNIAAEFEKKELEEVKKKVEQFKNKKGVFI